MERIYHSYDKWEDFKNGFYDNISGKNKDELIKKVIELFSSYSLTKKYMTKVIEDWIYSCEHNLTNNSLNKIAYIGQAACCLYAGCPNTITMEAWSLVDEKKRNQADSIAKEVIKKWESNQKNKQLCLKLY